MSDPNSNPLQESATPLSVGGCGVAIILAVAVLLVHGWSLGDGLSLDDHWHYHQLKNGDGSFGELYSATTIYADGISNLWWRDKPVRFKYARPLAVGLMRGAYALSGWRPVAVHAVSLMLHWVAACLVWRLIHRVVVDRWCGLWGALFFVVYPLNVFAVSWPAAQNMVLMTCLILGSLLAFARATGWRVTDGTSSAKASHSTQTSGMVLSFALWIAALASRENAIMLPVVLLAMDFSIGGWRRIRSRLGWHAAFVSAAIVFVAWRVGVYGEDMPAGYVRQFGDDGFVLWCVAKLVFYWACSIWPAPMVIGPSARYQPFNEAPGDYVAMAMIVVGFTVAYAASARRVRGWWIWLVWIVLATLPVTTVMATPHSGYLCGVGIILGSVIAVACIRKTLTSKWKAYVSVSMIIVLVGAGGICKLYRLMWRGMHYAEQVVFTGLAADPPPADADIFMINMPFAATYARMWMSDAIECDVPPDRFHVLTYAPSTVRADAMCIVERVGLSKIRIQTDQPGWFSGFLGQFLINGMREAGVFIEGETIHAPSFDVQITSADSGGVREIEFAFPKPLNDEGYAFYLTSEQCGALRLRFEIATDGELRPLDKSGVTLRQMEAAMQAIRGGNIDAADVLFTGTRSQDPRLRTDAWLMLRDTVAHVANAFGSPAYELFDSQHPTSDDIDRIRRWWHLSGIDENALASIFEDRARFLEMLERRDELKRGRELIESFVQSDLYLTGQPFPGPQ